MFNKRPPEYALFQAIKMTSYKEKEKVANFIISTFSEPSISKIFLRAKQGIYNQEVLFIISHFIKASSGGTTYNIDLIISLPQNFPTSPPNVYIESKDNLSINNFYLNGGIINQTTLQINFQIIASWNPNQPNFSIFLHRLQQLFNQYFPCTKDLSKKSNYVGDCKIQFDNLPRVFINPITQSSLLQQQITNKSVVSNNYNPNSSYIGVKNNPYSSEITRPPQKKIFTFRDACEIIKREILFKAPSVVQIQMIELKSDKDRLEQLLASLNKKSSENINPAVIQNSILEYRNLQNDYLVAQNYAKSKLEAIQNLSSQTKDLSIETITNFVKIKNQDKFKYHCMEKTLQEYLAMMKRLVEKNIIEFQVATKNIRDSSRQLFYIHYLINKP